MAVSYPLVAGGAVLIGALAWMFVNSRKAKAATKNDPSKLPPPKSDYPEDYAAGYKDGTLHGMNDGKIGVKNTRPLLNYNADTVRQKNYEKGYYEGYGAAFDAAKAEAGLGDLGDLFTKDVVAAVEEEKVGPTGGGKDGKTTTKKDALDWYNVGFQTGKKNGEFDGKNAALGKGSFGATPRPSPPTDDPIPRDAWSNGYEKGYGNGFDVGQASVKTGGGDAFVGRREGATSVGSLEGVSRVGAWGTRRFVLVGGRA